MRKRDYYDVLQVPRGAVTLEIRRAYRRLARQCSPDINLCDAGAGSLFEEITEAYRVLADPAARALYDRLGHRAFAARDETPGGPPRGEDLHYPVEIDFGQAFRGTTMVVDVARLGPCLACEATGGARGRRIERCPACQGQPIRFAVLGSRPVTTRCQACGATGWQLPEPCPGCGGRGTVPEQVRVPVTIPPGVDTGAQVRLPGEGHAAPAPGRRGDLVVITRVQPHPLFSRKGDNLCCEVPITVPEAALGARIPIPTPDGPAILTVPAGTQSGQAFRVRGRGYFRLDRAGRGDLLVTTRVIIPRNADSTLEEVLRAFQRLSPEDPREALWARAGTRPGNGTP